MSSSNSEPMASIADAYLSLLKRDSETINSANNRTRSSSVLAVASFCANNAWRLIASCVNEGGEKLDEDC